MTDAEIDALAVPAWKKTIFRAMARYGMYFGDTGGGSNWGIQVESDTTVYVGGFQNDINWASKLRVVAPCVGQGTC
jgi:hypothetical protein